VDHEKNNKSEEVSSTVRFLVAEATFFSEKTCKRNVAGRPAPAVARFGKRKCAFNFLLGDDCPNRRIKNEAKKAGIRYAETPCSIIEKGLFEKKRKKIFHKKKNID